MAGWAEGEGKADARVLCIGANSSEKPLGGRAELTGLLAGASTLMGLCWETVVILVHLQPGEMQ